MLMLRTLTWAGVCLAVLALWTALSALATGQLPLVATFTTLFATDMPLTLRVHHYSLALLALLTFTLHIGVLVKGIKPLTLSLWCLLLYLLLFTDLLLSISGGTLRGIYPPQAHSFFNVALLWLWYWLSLRLQGPLQRISKVSLLRSLAGLGAALLLSLFLGIDTQLHSPQAHTISTALTAAVLTLTALYALFSQQTATVRRAGIYLTLLILAGVASSLLTVSSTVHIVLSALSMLPLLAIRFYTRYTTLLPVTPALVPAAPNLPEQAITPSATAVTEVVVPPEVITATPLVETSLYLRLKNQLQRTRSGLGQVLASIQLGQRKIDADLLEDIESSLIMADVGMNVTMDIIGRLNEQNAQEPFNAASLSAALKQELLSILTPCAQPLSIPKQDKPYVILVVGINGAGKTTTIGKIAKRLQAQGYSVMLAAGDTFRAAAVEQLQVWGQRNNIHVVAQHTGADSASVIYDGVQSALAKKVDVLIADTAGRLHTKSNLMEELKKVKRIMAKLDDSAPHEVLLVLDAGTGQNAVSQTQLFNDAVALTGLVLTKLDGTAKGGIIFALAKQFGIPIRYIGIGEGIDDLQDFSAEAFVEALLVKDD